MHGRKSVGGAEPTRGESIESLPTITHVGKGYLSCVQTQDYGLLQVSVMFDYVH